VPVRAPGRDLTSALARPPAMTARRLRPPERRLLSRRLRSRLRARTGRPTGPRTAHPIRPPTALPASLGVRLTELRAGCRRSRLHPRPGPVRAATRRLRGPLAVQGLRGFLARRGPRLPRRTSGVPVPARLALRALGPVPPVPPVPPRARPGSARPAQAAAPISRVRLREPLGSLGLPGPGRLRPGPQDQARPGRVRPGRAERVPVPVVARVPAPGRAITRSARPPLAWARPLRPGLRRPARPVSRLRPAVRDSRPAPPAVPVPPAVLPVLVLADADRVGRVGPAARPMVARVPVARVPAVPGRAR
jgi:hypothetical protein